MSKKYEKAKKHYSNGSWDTSKVRDAVDKGWITAKEYEEITGEACEEEG